MGGESILVPLLLALVVVPFPLMTVLDVRAARKRLLHAPRLTVREVRNLDRLPKWVALRAQTGPASAAAPLSGVDCVWYRLEAGRMVTVGSNEGQMLVARYTATAPEDHLIPLVDPGDPENVIWLDPAFAGRRLDRKLPTLIVQPIQEVVPFTESAGAEAGWAHLRRLEAEGRLTAKDLAPGADSSGLGVTESFAPADTPVLVIARPVRHGNRVSLHPTARLSGTTTCSDPEIEARLASRARFWRWMLAVPLLVTVAACAGAPLWT